MRYLESRESSAELLRLALPLMARQDAAYHPVSYALWYEHVGGLNPRLSEVLTTRLSASAPLTEEDVNRFYRCYIEQRELEDQERWQHQVRTLLSEAAQDATCLGETGAGFAQSLAHGQTQLRAASGGAAASEVIAQLLQETHRVLASSQAIAKELRAKAEQVDVLAQQLRQAQAEALLDPLCGLKNRRGFDRAVTEVFTAGTAGEVALLLADVDHFKQLNDTYGHLLGDKVLRVIAQAVQANIKGRDIAARVGGDEFSVLLPHTTLRGAEALAEQIRAAVARGRIQRPDGQSLRSNVTVSIGVAMGAVSEGFDALMSRADSALYQAKRAGRNRIYVANT